jgi:hypothetical protein
VERKDLENKLAVAPVLVELDGKQMEAVEEFFKSDVPAILWGLMLGSKQAHYVALSNSPLTNMETVSRAAVIQGQIKGIDLFYDTLLELTIPSQEQE